MRSVRPLALALGLLCAGGAGAAPVTTDLRLSLTVTGLPTVTVTYTGVAVDATGTTVTLPAVAATGLGIIVPVTTTTSVAQIGLDTIGLQGGIFSVGGVTAQLPSEVCPGSPGPRSACNVGGGIGGAMGLTGNLNVTVIPATVVIPVNLDAALIGQGGSTNAPFTFDAAGFTTATGLVNTGAATIATTGSSTPFVLVSPTFVDTFGNLIPIFTRITLTNVSIAVPEPGALLLVLAGIGGLVGVARAGTR